MSNMAIVVERTIRGRLLHWQRHGVDESNAWTGDTVLARFNDGTSVERVLVEWVKHYDGTISGIVLCEARGDAFYPWHNVRSITTVKSYVNSPEHLAALERLCQQWQRKDQAS